MEALFGGWRHPALAIGGKKQEENYWSFALASPSFEPKLPNFSIASVFQNSDPGILRNSNQDYALYLIGNKDSCFLISFPLDS